jgi:hypothetical protein
MWSSNHPFFLWITIVGRGREASERGLDRAVANVAFLTSAPAAGEPDALTEQILPRGNGFASVEPLVIRIAVSTSLGNYFPARRVCREPRLDIFAHGRGIRFPQMQDQHTG